MASELRVVHTPQGWFVETPVGNIGPIDSQQEADQYVALMHTASIARAEMACTDWECFT
ncbi:MAG: hypothetical protein HY080_09635 [Gammaproteobacteria bacterium]|nr:hypothetical protein [Gammaproteobacteria bacterium]